MIGKTISHYTILERLGQGGMGVVYKAQDLTLDRLVALKFLPPHVGQDAEEKKRFIHEARAASAMDHPNICTIYEAGESEEGQLFLAMAHYEGETLQQKIGRGPLRLEEAVDIALQISGGLSKAHERGIVHRDLKPANVMITADGLVKILDFGLAKLAGRTMLTKEGTTLGTVAYMSPEQARGEAIDRRADIWALGVVLYEMLAGTPPFRGEYEQAIIYSLLNEDPDPITAMRSGVPMELERIAGKAMAKSPGERYQRLEEFIVDLKAVGKKIEAGSISQEHARPRQTARTSPKLVRPPLIVASIVAGVLILMAISYLLWHERMVPADTASIAVLPFANESGTKDTEYLSDGITESLIDHLSPISSLKVMARSTVFHFKNRKADPIRVGKQLEVGYVLSGRVDQHEGRLIVGSELIDVSSGAQVWGERYNRQMTDIFAIEEEISQNISEKLRLRLGVGERQKLSKRYTDNTEAYELYLKGRFHWNKRSKEAMPVALKYFREAVQIDPNYALAWSGISDCYTVSYGVYLGISSTEAFAEARSAIDRALSIDKSLAEAQASLGAIETGEFHWEAAEQAFERALELNPGYATAHQWYGEFLYTIGRNTESIAELQKALELDPLSLIINSVYSWAYLAARDAEKAIDQARRTLDMEPDFFDAQDCLAQALVLARRPESEIFPELIKRDSLLISMNSSESAGLRFAFNRHGLHAYWQERLSILRQRETNGGVWRDLFAECYAQLGEVDRAIEELQTMYDESDPILSYIRIWVYFDPIRSDPRFHDIVRRINFPETSH